MMRRLVLAGSQSSVLKKSALVASALLAAVLGRNEEAEGHPSNSIPFAAESLLLLVKQPECEL
jgi:hypothetical protein